jgi:hypothetical protein
MPQAKISSTALLRGTALASLLLTLIFSSVGVEIASAATKSPEQLVQVAMGNAGQRKFVVINMSGTNAEGNYRDVWRANPNSGSLVESVVHPGATGHIYVTVLDRVVYEKIDTTQWAYAGLGAKYKAYENRWFVVPKSSSSYKSYLQQLIVYGALLIPLNDTQFTIQTSTKLHGVKVTGLEGALTGSNPAIPVTLYVSKAKHSVPLEISVERTAKNKENVWTATFAYRASASPIVKPTTSLVFP